MNEIEIYDGALNCCEIYEKWFNRFKQRNCGALITFSGIVREEDSISALSFDIYEPILRDWFNVWQEKARNLGAFVLFAHSKGDVCIHQSSYMCAVVSAKRKIALRLINEFVEDFKKNAPIWKYDIINSKRIYAHKRSQKLNGAGLLYKG